MAKFTAALQEIMISGHLLQLYVPDPASARTYYEAHPTQSPFWSQVWPAAIGLCRFLAAHTEMIAGKRIVELAAGLGLPSLLAAKYGRSVTMSDYLPEAIELMQQTIDHNKTENLDCILLNWNNIPDTLKTDVLLLSDVNYEPEVFDKVFDVISRFISEGTVVILSTPQRLMAKPFIERLLPFSRQQEEFTVERIGTNTAVTVFVLCK